MHSERLMSCNVFRFDMCQSRHANKHINAQTRIHTHAHAVHMSQEHLGWLTYVVSAHSFNLAVRNLTFFDDCQCRAFTTGRSPHLNMLYLSGPVSESCKHCHMRAQVMADAYNAVSTCFTRLEVPMVSMLLSPAWV